MDMFENDYTITGKHATFLKYLVAKNTKEDSASEKAASASIFERYIDVYMNAAVWGLLYSQIAKRDTTSTDRARIYADAFANERDNCVFLYRLVMLLDTTVEISQNERIDRAFRYDTEPEREEELRKNIELFNDYVRGGIELMYENFTDGCTTREDYMNKVHEILLTFKSEMEGVSYEEELAKLVK